MRIAVDVMGGDAGPSEMVPGALAALDHAAAHIILVGDENTISRELSAANAAGLLGDRVSVVHAPTSISMDEDPLTAVRHKRDSSLVVGARLVREGRAEALVSAGSTGALVAAGPLVVGRLAGIKRPALATPIPTLKGASVMLDVGANPDCKPEHLFQFAALGSAYASALLGVDRPAIGLLSNGTEPTKGNAVSLGAYELLSQSGLNFVGNIEGRTLLSGDVHVVVADGFAGNIALKLMEGVGQAIFDMVKGEVRSSTRAKLGALLMKPALRNVKRKMDYSEYGGAPLLGLAGLLVKAHGSSNRKAFASAVRVTDRLLEAGIMHSMGQAALLLNDEGAK